MLSRLDIGFLDRKIHRLRNNRARGFCHEPAGPAYLRKALALPDAYAECRQ